MTRARKTAPRAPRTVVKAGDYVLAGGGVASLPGEWFVGHVLWADGRDVLLHRTTQNGTDSWRQLEPIENIRAAGTIADLISIRREASDATTELSRAVGDAEHALGAARDAVWAKCRQLAEGGLKIAPHDDAASAERHAHDRVLNQQFEDEALA